MANIKIVNLTIKEDSIPEDVESGDEEDTSFIEEQVKEVKPISPLPKSFKPAHPTSFKHPHVHVKFLQYRNKGLEYREEPLDGLQCPSVPLTLQDEHIAAMKDSEPVYDDDDDNYDNACANDKDGTFTCIKE